MSPARALPVPPWALGLGLALLAALFFHHRIVTSGSENDLLVSDLHLYYLPSYELLYGALREGRLPLWNPFQICGVPQLASLQVGFFYPPHLVYLLVPAAAGWWISCVLHLALVAVGMACFVRRLGLGVGAALAAAIFLALRGRYPGMIFFPNMLEAAAWLPLGAVAVLGIAREGRARFVVLLAACAGLSLLAGYPQASVYVVYSWGALLLLLLASEGRGDGVAPAWRRWGSSSLLLGVALILGFALAAAQLLPAWELAGQGTRSPGPLTRAEQFPWAWPGPGFAGAFLPTVKAPFPSLFVSFGFTALAGLLASLAAPGRRLLALGCLALALLVLAFAMGPATPVFDLLSQLPAIGWFRFPRRALFMMDFFAAIAFAVGVDGVLRLVVERSPLSSLSRRSPLALAAITLAPASVIGLELFLAPPNTVALGRALQLMQHYQRQSPIYDRVAESGERAWIRSPTIESRQPPKLASYRRMKSVGDYEPVNQRRQSEYFTYLMEGRAEPKIRGLPYSGRLKHLTEPTYPDALLERGHLLDVAAVPWFVVQRTALVRGEIEQYVAEHGLVEDRELRDERFALLRNPHAVPRAYVVYEVRPAPETPALLEAMSERSFDPLAFSFAEGASRLPAGATRGGPADIVVDQETRVEVEAELARDGMLVLVDSWYPGWRASVDGEALEIYPVNHLFRGVMLPAGSHRVVFEYQPWTVGVGAAASVAALALLGLLWVRGRAADELPVPGRSDSIPAHEGPGPCA